jgi:plasmid maintenance system antidote protein VapI
MALRISEAFNTDPELCQAQRDLWIASHKKRKKSKAACRNRSGVVGGFRSLRQKKSARVAHRVIWF